MQIIDLEAEHEKRIIKEKKKQKDLKNKILDINKNVVKPMILEIKVKDELIKRLKEENKLNVKDLKMLNTIIRIPKMTTEF